MRLRWGGQAIPQQGRLLPAKRVAQLAERADQAVGVVGVGVMVHGHCCWAAFPSQPTMRQVTTTLLELITRVPSAERNRFYATALLIDELARRPRVVVIDEAQRLNRECIECLRHLHDHPATTFALLLVRGDGCWEVLSREPMLRSRIYRRVTFRPLESREVLDVLPRYHRLYQHVDGELLLFIDDNFAHGNFRNWASFTGWNSYTLRPSLNALSDTLRRELHRAHSGRASLNPKVAFILLGVNNVERQENVSGRASRMSVPPDAAVEHAPWSIPAPAARNGNAAGWWNCRGLVGMRGYRRVMPAP